MQNLQASGPFWILLTVVTSVVSLMTTIFWLVVGWRAMRAHEQIAEFLRDKRTVG